MIFYPKYKPRDFQMSGTGSVGTHDWRMEATIGTVEEANALIEIINHMKADMPSVRIATHSDLGIPEPAPATFHEKLVKAGLAP